jgi:hypothetical protein
VKAVVALLDEPADSVEDLAKDVIRKINELREGRKEYVVTLISDGIVSTWGPYDTVKEASKRAGEFIIASKPGKKGILTILHRDWDADHGEDDNGAE